MEISSLSGRGRKMSLTSALIDQAIALKMSALDLSEIEILRQLSGMRFLANYKSRVQEKSRP
jgi:hypothetical protein